METRRIQTPAINDRGQDNLKQIAGLIQKLSYRDMQKLAERINTRWVAHDDDSDAAMAECVLGAADDILVDRSAT